MPVRGEVVEEVGPKALLGYCAMARLASANEGRVGASDVAKCEQSSLMLLDNSLRSVLYQTCLRRLQYQRDAAIPFAGRVLLRQRLPIHGW